MPTHLLPPKMLMTRAPIVEDETAVALAAAPRDDKEEAGRRR
jgi:hypothetical protein